MPLHAGDCAWCDDGGGQHITIVLNNPKGNPPSVILVNITTWTQRKEQTVILEPKDHPDISRKSVVNYYKAAVVQEALAERLFRNPLQQISETVLKKIVDGFLKSDQVPEKVLTFFFQEY